MLTVISALLSKCHTPVEAVNPWIRQMRCSPARSHQSLQVALCSPEVSHLSRVVTGGDGASPLPPRQGLEARKGGSEEAHARRRYLQGRLRILVPEVGIHCPMYCCQLACSFLRQLTAVITFVPSRQPVEDASCLSK